MRDLSLSSAIVAACLAGSTAHPADLPVLWRQPLPGIVRGDQATIGMTVCADRPQGEFGNDWQFAVQIVPARPLGRGANTLLGTYEDGSTATIPQENRRIIADRYPSEPALATLNAVRIATPDRVGRDLFWMRWPNPHPGKALRSVLVEGSERAALLVVAVSAERP